MPNKWVKCRFPVFTSRDSDSLSLMWGINNHPYISDAGGQPLAWPLGSTALQSLEHFDKNVSVHIGLFVSGSYCHRMPTISQNPSQNYWSPFAFASTKSEEDLSVVDSSTWTQKNRWESSCSDQMTKLYAHMWSWKILTWLFSRSVLKVPSFGHPS